jgi:ketosteroid isomerase-like protein
MKTLKYLLIVLLMTFLSFHYCSKISGKAEELEKFKNTINEFYTALNSGDTDKRLSLFAPDAMVLSDGGRLTHVTDSVKAVWKSWDKDWIFRLKDIEHAEIDLSGDIAYTVNTYYYTWHSIGAEPVWHKTKNVHIWRKQTDGSWKLHVDIWNSDKSADR